MSETDHTTQGEDALGLLAIEVERLLAEGQSIDVERLAREHGVPVADAQDVVDALDAFEDVLFEPLEAAIENADEPIPPPTLPADYELVGELGRGGMGIVYRAHQKSLGRDVAIKVLRPGELTFGKMLRRFEQEAKSLARLKHPHIVSIHEVGKADGCVYFTMDLVEGKPLSELVKERQITPTEAVRLLRQVTSAIAYTHGLGVIHRDLKPANILVDTESRAFVVDFGLARDLAGPDELTRTGQVIGTANYMSPEQARGAKDRIGEATDVYALGAVLYECLTGQPPFHGKGLAELMTAILHEAPEPPSKADPRVPKALETICLKAMAKEPERRYPTARALLDDLERFEEGKSIRARPPGTWQRVRAGWQRNWRIATVGVAAAIVAGLSVLLLLLPQTGETVANLRETADNLKRDGEYEAAATVIERALALKGLRIPEDDEEAVPPPPAVRRNTLGLLAVWMRYRSRHVESLYRDGAYRKTMMAADDAADALARVVRMADMGNYRGSGIDARWYGALAAAHLGDESAASRFHAVFERVRSRPTPSIDRRGGGASMATTRYSIYRIRRELLPMLAEPDHALHAWARRFASALLASEAGREALLQKRRGPRGRDVNVVDHVAAIVKGAVRDAYDRPVDDPVRPTTGAHEGTLDATWFDVSNDLVVDVWRDLRNLLRRLSIGDAEAVYAALETLAREDDSEEPLIARWALGLLAIGLDLPPWWDRDAPPPTTDAEVDARIWELVEASRKSGADFLKLRVEAGNAYWGFDDPRSHRLRRWVRSHTMLPKAPVDGDGNTIAQDLLRGLLDADAAPGWHHLLVRSAKTRATSNLWCEWCMPEVSSGLEGSEESLYRLWLFQLAARRAGVVREDVLFSSRVIPFADGEITSQFPGLGAALMRWDR
ncbi:MAG: serine/threonine-protein kinase, partial [Planctomycetota bacterium]|nr:serine/threonine-protein kinase [Planctomycetota bacterium]